MQSRQDQSLLLLNCNNLYNDETFKKGKKEEAGGSWCKPGHMISHRQKRKDRSRPFLSFSHEELVRVAYRSRYDVYPFEEFVLILYILNILIIFSILPLNTDGVGS